MNAGTDWSPPDSLLRSCRLPRTNTCHERTTSFSRRRTGIRQSLSAVLQDEGYRVLAVATGEECLRALETDRFHLVLLDVWMRGLDGLEVLRRLQETHPETVVVMISGHGTVETAVRATKLGAFDFLEKPLSIERTLVVVKNALEHQTLLEENRQLRDQLEVRYRIIGESVPVKALRQQLALMAPTNGRVLIYGESGTGKELVAHALHTQSLRAKHPFVELNCAAIPEELIENELFGHVKGSFTGALDDKVGKFQKADCGTLFLDEVGDMSLKTQSKVLRALEEQRFEPVGASTSVSVDVRVIAATNKVLEEEITRGNFREDLFYRLMWCPLSSRLCESAWRMFLCWRNIFCGNFARATAGSLKSWLRRPWRS